MLEITPTGSILINTWKLPVHIWKKSTQYSFCNNLFCPESSAQEAPQVFFICIFNIFVYIIVYFIFFLIHIYPGLEKGAQTDRKKSTPFSFCHFNSASSIAKASMPQSTHDTMAIPLMKSALVTGTACLQLGHLYCLFEVISATRHYPAA